jgi:hypothetical protein
MAYKFQAEVGAFLWWVFIKFSKTDLGIEKKDENDARNIFFFYLLVILICIISVKVF